MYSGLPWHNIRLILTEKSPCVAVTLKRIWPYLLMNFNFPSSFFHKSSIVLVCHVCSSPSSVCFRLGLISSFYPLQFWWGPKCLLSDIAKENPHKPHKALQKLRAKLSRSLLSLAASPPLHSTAGVSMAAPQTGGNRSPRVLLLLHVWKHTLAPSTFPLFAPCSKQLIAGISGAERHRWGASVIYS